MAGIIAATIGVIIFISLLVLLVIGLWYSKVHLFKEGVYFFSLIIFYKIYSLIAPPIIRNYIDTKINANSGIFKKMTVGEMVALLSLIPKMIVFIAFIFLVVGLIRRFKNYSISK